MKRLCNLKIFVLVAFLAFALVFIGVDFIESQQVKTQGKPPSPPGQDKLPKPGKPKTEWIEFTGDLETPPGGEVVKGCCPNAGPFPPYNMILTFGSYYFDAGYHEGWLYINYKGAGRDRKYKVQFWWDYDNDLGIEIIGGVIDHDRKTKVLTVTFTNEECRHIKSKTPIFPNVPVSFVLVRHQYSPPDS